MRSQPLALALGLLVLGSSTAAAEGELLSGQVVKLAEVNEGAFSVNVGGLVIVVVRDSGSRPPQNVDVTSSPEFDLIGIVRGVQNDQGQPLMGGGYTWYLLRPTKAGEGTVQVSYLENGDGGKEVKRDYKVTVE